jgi:hypothetical protein
MLNLFKIFCVDSNFNGIGVALKYASSWDCFKKVLRNEGFFKLYKGLVPNLMGQVPEKAMRLFVVDTVRNQIVPKYTSFDRNTSKGRYLTEVIAGSAAGTCQVWLVIKRR